MHRTKRHPIGELKLTKISDEFFELQAFPSFWQAKGMELHRSALVLANQFAADSYALSQSVRDFEEGRIAEQPSFPTSVMSQFLLLAAFSIENLFKGLVLFKEPGLVSAGRITGIIKSHDLIALAARADVQLTSDEQRFCQLASSASIYWGRYPTSNSADSTLSSSTTSSAAFALFDQLALRVSALYSERFHTRTRKPPRQGA